MNRFERSFAVPVSLAVEDQDFEFGFGLFELFSES